MFKKLLYYFFLIIVFNSCETIVDVDLPKIKPMIVLNSICTPSNTWNVNLTASKNILDGEPLKPIENADIKIIGKDTLTDLLYYKNGTYKTNWFKPKTNINYEIQVSAKGFKTVTSHCLIPEPVKIESVEVDTIVNEYQRKELQLTISFTDPPNKKNFYSLEVLRVGTYNGKKNYYPEYFTSNDLIIDNNDNNLFEGSKKRFRGNEAFFNDDIVNGKKYKMIVFIELSRVLDKQIFEVVLNSLTNSYYKYIKSQKLQRETRDNPFAEPVIVYSNIKNGLGIFAGYSSSKYLLE